MTEADVEAQSRLRGDILAGGRSDWVSMAEVRDSITRRRLARAAEERQQLMLRTIRSLLEDGLVEVGDIPGPGDPGFMTWPGSLDDVMESLKERIVGRFDDPDSWEFSTWLNLTARGRQASDEVIRSRSDNRGC